MRNRILIAALLLLAPVGAPAQSVVQNAWYDIKHAGLDVIHVYAGPFHGSQSDWSMFGIVVGGAAAISLLDDDIDAWLASRQQGFIGDVTKPFRDPPGVHFGSGHRMMKVLALVWGSGLALESRTLRDAGMGCMAAIQTNALLRSFLYKTVSRTRPLVANGDQYQFDFPGGAWDYHAFPGGHGANAHACASFISDRFDLDWFSAILHGAAAGISLGRMVDRRHWASDAVIGAALGISIGRTIAIRSRNRAESTSANANGSNHGFSFHMLDDGAILIGYNIRF